GALAVRRLRLRLALEGAPAEERVVETRTPVRDPGELLVRIARLLESQPPRSAVAGADLTIDPVPPRRAQLGLFHAGAIAPERLAATLHRLAARLGPERVGSP